MHVICIQMVLLRFVWWNFFRFISYITTADVKQRSQHEVCFVTVSNRFKWYSKFLIVVNHPNVLKVSPWVFKRIRSQFYHLEVLPGVAFERHSHGCLCFKGICTNDFWRAWIWNVLQFNFVALEEQSKFWKHLIQLMDRSRPRYLFRFGMTVQLSNQTDRVTSDMCVLYSSAQLARLDPLTAFVGHHFPVPHGTTMARSLGSLALMS